MSIPLAALGPVLAVLAPLMPALGVVGWVFYPAAVLCAVGLAIWLRPKYRLASLASSHLRARAGNVQDARAERGTDDLPVAATAYDRGVIAISLLTLAPGQHGGSESATIALLRTLARSGTLPYRVLLPPTAPEFGQGLPSEVVHEYHAARTLPQRLAAMTAAAARPGPLRRHYTDADVVHYPLTIRLPALETPTVVTLHDVQHLDLPGLFSRGERAFRALAYHRSAHSAQIVIVPSEFVRDRAVERLGLDAARVRVIHHGIDHDRFSPSGQEREEFILYPARGWAHKNHKLLLEAFAQLRVTRPGLRLVLTGGGHTETAPAGVEIRGHVSDAELVSLYRRAAVLVFPSLYEGFGQPVLEAMACGCPVASSNAASLPEVCSDAARLFDPHSAEAIAEAVAEVLDDPQPWTERGLARAAPFTWEASAEGHEAAYRDAVAGLA
ncbi:MAG: glycosyltransferase family 1 protein [Actinomycetes bacterium]